MGELIGKELEELSVNLKCYVSSQIQSLDVIKVILFLWRMKLGGMWAPEVESRVEEKNNTGKGELKAMKREPKSKNSGVDGRAPEFCVSSCEAWGSHRTYGGS